MAEDTSKHSPTQQGPSEPPSYREVTFAAIFLALLIGVVMNAAITYAGLKIGFTIGGSAIAAVIGFGLLRVARSVINPKAGTIIESNIVQTAASAVNTSNSGVIFTVPVLLLIGIPLVATGADFWLITAACVAGAFLGTAFIIPLRKQMIDIDRLRFPSATGVAVILKSPGAGPKKLAVLVVGLLLGALIFIPVGLPQIGETLATAAENAGRETSGFATFLQSLAYENIANSVLGEGQQIITGEQLDLGRALGIPLQFNLVFAIAPFALGAGFITGRPGLLVLAGGILAYYILTPIAFSLGWMPETITSSPELASGFAFQAFNRPLGIGLLLGGALTGVALSLPSIREAIKSVAAASKVKSGEQKDELGLKPLIAAGIAALILLFLAADFVTDRPLNDTCPVSGQSLVAADAPEPTADVTLPSAEAPPASGSIEESVTTLTYAGYKIAFADQAAADTWTVDWSDEEKRAFLDTYNAKPGLLAGLPHHVRAAIIAIIGALWIWFAGIIIAQCTGMTDWSPISGMALITVVLILLLAGTGAVVGAVLIGAALCVAITLAADMMGDLRTGHLVGAIPRRQQLVELSVVGIGPVVAMLVVLLIAAANTKQFGIPIGPGTPTVAPQAQALEAVITGVQGGEMPYALYGFGALLGVILGLGAFSGLGVLIGLSMYLPFYYIATYGIGCVVQMILQKTKSRAWTEEWGVPFAAGLIVGETILALLVNIIVLTIG